MSKLLTFLAPYKLYAGLGAAILIGLSVLWYGHARHEAGVRSGKAQIQAQWDAEKAAQAKAASKINAKADSITEDVGKRAEAAQVVIQTRFKTLIEKVPQSVQSADPVVPDGLVQLLDQAAAGGDPDAVSVAAGRTHERASPTHLSTLAPVVVANYGLAHQNARQLSDLQSWVRQQQDANPPH